MPASYQDQFHCLRLGIESEGFLALGFQQELNGLLEIGQTFLLGFALAVGAGNFQACRPETALLRFAPVRPGERWL